jgi:hypothetical protein
MLAGNFLNNMNHSFYCKQNIFVFCLFLLFFSVSVACNNGVKKEIYQTSNGQRVSLRYTGREDFSHGSTLTIGSVHFVHDSMYLFRNANRFSKDIFYLPSFKYIRKILPNGRAFYENTSAISVLQLIGETIALNTSNDSLEADVTKLYATGVIFIFSKKRAFTVSRPLSYPLQTDIISE